MTRRFENKLVLITGAAGGMGQAFARRFAAEGAALVLTDVDEQALETSSAELRALGAICSSFRVDLAKEDEIKAFGAQLCAAHPRLDVLINNAGIAYGRMAYGFQELTQQDWLQILSINTLAPLWLAQALRAPLASARGNILNITSMASFVPANAYGVSKAALNAVTFGMAGAFGPDAIRVNAIAPGLMATPAARASLPPETFERIRAQQLLSQHGTPDDVVSLGLFLASDDAQFITCEIVSCDGGHRMRGFR